jgi:glycosyltransferase involved in cell wall biosynthesis
MVDRSQIKKIPNMKNNLRIAYLIDTISSDKAGTEKQLLNLIERLDYTSIIICLHDSPWLSSNRLPCEVVILGYRGFLNPTFPLVIARYLRCLKERNIDIVQTFFEDSMFVGCLGKTLSRMRHTLIVSRRDLGLGSDEPAYHWLYKKIRPLIYRVSDAVAVNALAIKTQTLKYEKVPTEKIKVIGNGIDLPESPSALPVLFSKFQADAWICIVANLKPVKRIDLLLRALAYLKQNGVKETVRVVIIGEGRLNSELHQLAADIGIDDFVHFVGAVNNVSDYLFGVDIGVLCSDKEGLSNAILEYMACGLPVVATNAGGNSELVDETNGACVPVGDHVAMAQELTKLIISPSHCKKKGDRSLEKVRQNYTWDKIIPQWESYYGSFSADPDLSDNLTVNGHA